MMKRLSKNECRKLELEMLNIISEICEKNNLKIRTLLHTFFVHTAYNSTKIRKKRFLKKAQEKSCFKPRFIKISQKKEFTL